MGKTCDEIFPKGIRDGDKAEVIIIGTYEDHQVSCDIVEWKEFKFQPFKQFVRNTTNLLHVTKKVENGRKALQSGYRATDHGYTTAKEKRTINGTWTIFY
jgi:hypothetical protein